MEVDMPRLALALSVFLSAAALANPECPSKVSDAAIKAHPGAKVSACKQEKEHGSVQYEVKLTLADQGKLELDVTPEGAILQTEEVVKLDAVPKEAVAGFNAKYRGAKPSKVERQTKADGSQSFEFAFADAKGKHESTFKADGTFVEEE
jgi:hypothetical protein